MYGKNLADPMKSFGVKFHCSGIFSVFVLFFSFSPPPGFPVGSEALPAGFKALPAVSEAFLAGSKALPAGFKDLTAGSDALPAGPSALS